MTEPSNQQNTVTAFLRLLGRFRDEEAAIYNMMAPGYDRFAQDWDARFARPALDHLLAEAAKRTPPNARVLDAGCGTGLRMSEIAETMRPAELVGVDISDPMLNMARRKRYQCPVSFVNCSLHSLPFEDSSFDAIVATWGNPGQAVQELLRVVKPGGVVAYSFVQIPTNPELIEDLDTDSDGRVDADLREALAPSHLPFHDCEHSSLAYFRKGLIATVILGKCCEVTSRILPRPFEDFIE